MFAATHDNLAEDNIASGNTNGFVIGPGTHGNVLRRNLIVGNPPVQVSLGNPSTSGVDIRNESDAGAVTFEENHCITYMGVEPAPCPNLGEPRGDAEQESVANFVRNRLASPQARLVNAVFHPSSSLSKSAGSALPPKAGESDSVTVTGKVVDAACYMLHVAAATDVSHMKCGVACLARGVPLAIATDDHVLYFPADGNQRLKTLLNARVRASGTVVEKHDPMELKMPVGDKNQMTVRIEGGYKQLTIDSLEKVQARKRNAS